MANYDFLDAHASVKTALSSTIGGVERPVLTVDTLNNSSISGTVLVGGTTAVTQSGTWQPSAVGYATRNDTLASTLGADGTLGETARDSAGRQITKPFASSEVQVEGVASTVSTSTVALIPAGGAGLRNYITDIHIANSGASDAIITFTDATTSILGHTIAPTLGGSNMNITTPIRTGANSAFRAEPKTASSVIYLTVRGYKAP